MGLMEQFADPNLMHELSMSDKLAGAGITTIMGMGITFVILLLLWGCISLMTKFTFRPEKGDKAPKAVAAAVPSGAETQSVTTQAADDALIAVITAAIAASEGGSTNNLVVRKITRLSGQTTVWGNAGRLDCIDSRKF